MAIKREYNILPQGDKDDFHHHVKDGKRGASSQYICLFTLITIVIFAILAGVAILTASMFYSDQLSKTFGHFWYSYESTSANGSNNTNTSGDSSSFTVGSWVSTSSGSRNVTTSVPHFNSTDYLDHTNKSLDSNHHNHHHKQHAFYHLNNHSSFENNSLGESDLSNSWGNATTNSTSDSDESESSMENKEQDIINVKELKEKFAEAMRDFEKHMENLTGIRKAEFVVPIFMLMSFLALFSIISICCCIMMRRRESRRRKLFGKLITDLQTGDSKTVLLNHSDLDD